MAFQAGWWAGVYFRLMGLSKQGYGFSATQSCFYKNRKYLRRSVGLLFRRE